MAPRTIHLEMWASHFRSCGKARPFSQLRMYLVERAQLKRLSDSSCETVARVFGLEQQPVFLRKALCQCRRPATPSAQAQFLQRISVDGHLSSPAMNFKHKDFEFPPHLGEEMREQTHRHCSTHCQCSEASHLTALLLSISSSAWQKSTSCQSSSRARGF